MRALTVLAAVALLLTACGSDSKPKRPDHPAVQFDGDGPYQVGVDIEAGTYAVYRLGAGDCSWLTDTNPHKKPDSVTDGDDAKHIGDTLIAREGEYVEAGGGCTWVRRPG